MDGSCFEILQDLSEILRRMSCHTHTYLLRRARCVERTRCVGRLSPPLSQTELPAHHDEHGSHGPFALVFIKSSSRRRLRVQLAVEEDKKSPSTDIL